MYLAETMLACERSLELDYIPFTTYPLTKDCKPVTRLGQVSVLRLATSNASGWSIICIIAADCRICLLRFFLFSLFRRSLSFQAYFFFCLFYFDGVCVAVYAVISAYTWVRLMRFVILFWCFLVLGSVLFGTSFFFSAVVVLLLAVGIAAFVLRQIVSCRYLVTLPGLVFLSTLFFWVWTVAFLLPGFLAISFDSFLLFRFYFTFR